MSIQLRATKLDLAYHVDEEHEDLIPQGYSAARIVFNHVNKKEHGTYIQCGKESDLIIGNRLVEAIRKRYYPNQEK